MVYRIYILYLAHIPDYERNAKSLTSGAPSSGRRSALFSKFCVEPEIIVRRQVTHCAIATVEGQQDTTRDVCLGRAHSRAV